MAFLDSKLFTVEAILTQKGREALAKNDGSFNITYFALGDDEIDYSLWNPNHPKGSAFFGEAIENIPVFEANPNQSQVLVSKLISLPKGTSKIPILSIGAGSIVLKQGATTTITPQTLNFNGSNTTYEANGYIVTVNDVRLLSTFKGTGVTDTFISSDTTVSGANVSKSEIGTSFSLTATTLNTLFTSNLTELVTTITVTGRDSGAFISIPLIIQKK